MWRNSHDQEEDRGGELAASVGEDPGTPMISYSIFDCHFKQALCDLGASINIMPKVSFEKLSYPALFPTMMCVQLDGSTIQYPEGIVENLLVLPSYSQILWSSTWRAIWGYLTFLDDHS